MLSPVLITPPDDTPVSLAEAKTHLGEESNEFDAKITRMIQSATTGLDGWSGELGMCIVTQTWRQDFSAFCSKLRLRLSPVKSVEIAYYDSDNTQQALDETVYGYLTDALGTYVYLKPDQTWPSTYSRDDAVSVTFVAGEAVPDVPEDIKSAILIAVERDYDPVNYERYNQLQGAYERLVNKLRRWTL